MTRTFNEVVRCKKCGNQQTNETDFERWMRNSSDLDSRSAGIVRFDVDVLLHKYKTLIDNASSRDVQFMMFVEVKTMMAEPSESQIDTLSLLNNVLRNRQVNMHQTPRKQMGGQLRKVYSHAKKKEVRLYLFGGHLLQISGTDPVNSERMLWDRKPITAADLIRILRFEVDPDNPQNILDIRRRSRPFAKQLKLFPEVYRRYDIG
jgi:hypothetical protein